MSGPPACQTEYSQKNANPPHMMENGMKPTSDAANRTPGSGCPLQTSLSSDLTSRRSCSCTSHDVNAFNFSLPPPGTATAGRRSERAGSVTTSANYHKRPPCPEKLRALSAPCEITPRRSLRTAAGLSLLSHSRPSPRVRGSLPGAARRNRQRRPRRAPLRCAPRSPSLPRAP